MSKPREYWILKNLLNPNECLALKTPPNEIIKRDCTKFIEHSAYLLLKQKADKLAELINEAINKLDEIGSQDFIHDDDYKLVALCAARKLEIEYKDLPE